MSKWLFLLIAACLYECVPSKWSPEEVCGRSTIKSRSLKLSLRSSKNGSSEWVDTFSVLAESSDSSSTMDVDLTQTVMECNNKRSVFIQGITKASTYANQESAPTNASQDDPLHFHSRCGTNVGIFNGQSAIKINANDSDNSAVFTHRPLRNGEMFDVRIDKKIREFYSFGLGIIIGSADSVEILPDMWKSPVAWVYLYNKIYSNGTVKQDNYGLNIAKLKEGDRVGVIRSESGTLNFFINGVDQGPAASNIPSPVNGMVDLRYSLMMVSIVDSPTPN